MLISRKRYKIETYFQWKTNRKSFVAYRMAPVLVTLNDLEGIRRLQAFSSAIRRTFVQYFARFQLTACSCSPSATAGLFVILEQYAYAVLLLFVVEARLTSCTLIFISVCILLRQTKNLHCYFFFKVSLCLIPSTGVTFVVEHLL